MKTNDKIIDIKINLIRTQNFHDDETKKKAIELRSAEIRIMEIELKTKKGKNTQKYWQAICPMKNSVQEI